MSTPAVTWVKTEKGLRPFLDNKREVTWTPQPGSQTFFLSCPVFETLYTGTRGPGKTDALLMDFAQHCGQGFGADWRGILFRRTYPELQDVIDKSKKWVPRIWPRAKFNEAKSFWSWPTGEVLYFRFFEKKDHYWKYHGHAYPWQGWEELTNWPDASCYKSMFSCARSTAMGIPIKIRATTNPYGKGHNWVKARWRLPFIGAVGPVIRNSRDDAGEIEPPRVAIHGSLSENRILTAADPHYIRRLRSAARNKSERKAWLEGSWDIVAGGMLDDIWDSRIHQVPSLPFKLIPKEWRIDRSYDHGQSKPFSVGWWIQSNGEPVRWQGHTYGAVPGDLYRLAGWYGWNGKPNEGIRMLSTAIASGILERESDWGISGQCKPGPADSSIFGDDPTGVSGKTVSGEMLKLGVRWEHADKRPGSRKQGWEQIRKLLSQAIPEKDGTRDLPGLFCMDRDQQFIRTLPVLPRSDKDLDDVDTESEDHIADEVRYRVRFKDRRAKQKDFR